MPNPRAHARASRPHAVAADIAHPSARRSARWREALAWSAVVATASLAALASRHAVGQDVLDLAPDDAEMLVVFPDPQGMSDRLAELSTQVGMPMPGAQDVLGQMMQKLGNPDGIDKKRPMAMAMSDLATAMNAGGGSEPAVLMLVPVSDYGALVSSLGGTNAQGVTPLVMPDGSEGFIRKVEGYAVLGETEAAVEGYAPSGRARTLMTAAGDYTQRLADKPHVMMLIDTAKLGPAMSEAMGMVEGQMQNQPNMNDAAAEAMAANMAMGRWMTDLVGGADAALMTIDLSGSSVTLGVCAKFPDDAVASSILVGKPSGDVGSRFTALPNRPLLMAMGMDFSGIDAEALMSQMIDALPDSAAGQKKMYEASLPMAEQILGGAAGFYVPTQPAMGLSGLFNVSAVYEVKDAKAFTDAFAAYSNEIDGVAMAIPVPGQNGEMTTADLVTRATYTPDALTLEGVELAEWSVSQELPAEVMQQMGQMAAMMQQSYSGYVGARDGKAFVTTGQDVGLLQATIAEAGQGLTADGPTARVLNDSPLPDRAMAGYVSLQGVGQMANNFLPMFGMPPIDVPADLTPINAAMGSSDGQMIVEVNLPVDSVAFLVQQAMQMQAMMGGMGGPGGPPPSQRQPGQGPPPAPQ